MLTNTEAGKRDNTMYSELEDLIALHRVQHLLSVQAWFKKEVIDEVEKMIYDVAMQKIQEILDSKRHQILLKLQDTNAQTNKEQDSNPTSL